MRRRTAAAGNERYNHVGVLVREVPVRVVNISRSGCLLESPTWIETGTGGELKVQVGRTMYSDAIRIARRMLVEGSGAVYRVGVELLGVRPLSERSLRTAIRRVLANDQPAQ